MRLSGDEDRFERFHRQVERDMTVARWMAFGLAVTWFLFWTFMLVFFIWVTVRLMMHFGVL